MSRLSRRVVAGGLVVVLAFAGAACSDDDEAPSETGIAPTTTTTEATTTTTEEETTTTTAAAGDAADVVTIIGTNDGTTSYAFEDVPTSPIPAGTKLSLQNTGTEPHELIALRIPDSETRTIDEIAALPEDQQSAIFGADPQPATVILAATGQTDTPGAVVGDGTLTEPGRYAIICALPVGSTDELLAADGPPSSDGPTHVSLGMYAQIEVQ